MTSPADEDSLYLLSGLEEVLGGSDNGHVVVCVYGTYSDAISIYLHFVVCILYIMDKCV